MVIAFIQRVRGSLESGVFGRGGVAEHSQGQAGMFIRTYIREKFPSPC